MKWSWTVGRFWGTELRLHISLLLLLPYILFISRPSNVWDAAWVLALQVGVFACVALHEAGHTLAARLYGIEVKSITLWPLGGFANLSRRPEKIFPDLVIVSAGPLTNLVLALGFGVLALLEYRLLRTFPALYNWLQSLDVFPFLVGMIITNLALALFNLIPIYPLDGGQIARDLLKLVFGEKRADQILIFFSLPLALGVCLLGLFSRDVILMLTGVILLLASSSLNLRASNLITLGLAYLVDRGGYYMRTENYEAAIEAYSAALRRRPEQAGLYVSRGIAYLTIMTYDQARADLERALQLDPQHALAWALRGELHDLQGEDEQALFCYNRAIALRPDFAIAYADRGSLHHKLGDLAQAQADLDRAAALGSHIAAVRILRSLFRYQIGDHAGALEDAEYCLRFAPHWMLVFPAVFLENFRGRLGWVLEYYNRAVKRNPNAYQAYLGRADALAVNDRLDWAIEDYNRAIQLAPNQAGSYLNRGLAYLRLGHKEKAAADFERVLTMPALAHLRNRAGELRSALQQVGGGVSTEPSSLTGS